MPSWQWWKRLYGCWDNTTRIHWRRESCVYHTVALRTEVWDGWRCDCMWFTSCVVMVCGVSGAHIIMYCSVFWFGFSDAFHSSHFTLGKCFVVQLPASAPSNYIVLFVGNKNQTECRTPSSRAPLCSVSVLRKKKWRTKRKTQKKRRLKFNLYHRFVVHFRVILFHID